jgi:hypothetical protein
MRKLCLYGGEKKLLKGGVGEECEHEKGRVHESERGRKGERAKT